MTNPVRYPDCITSPKSCRKVKCPFWKSFRRSLGKAEKQPELFERYDQCLFVALIEKEATEKLSSVTTDLSFSKENYHVEGDLKMPF